MVKLTPDMSQEMAQNLMREAASISLDGQEINPEDSPKVSNSSKPTRRDFYDMDDDEIEQYLGVADNPDGSFEQLLRGFKG